MNTKFEMPHVIITGTTRGLGFNLCQLYLQNGYSVTGFSRSEAPSAFQEFIKNKQYDHVILDLGELKTIDVVISVFLSHKTETVIINAADYSVITGQQPETFFSQLKLNLLWPILFIENLLSQNIDFVPKIIFISSIMAEIYDAKNPGYGAAKAAVSHYIDGVRIKTKGKINFLKVIAGPLVADDSKLSFLRRLTSITYSNAAKLIFKKSNYNEQELTIAFIWKYILWTVRMFGKQRISVILNTLR